MSQRRVSDDGDKIRQNQANGREYNTPAAIKRTRWMLEQAGRLGLSSSEAKVALAVVYFITLRGRVSGDRVSRQQLEEISGLAARQVRAGLRGLAMKGLIVYQPGFGGRPSDHGWEPPRAPFIALPNPGEGSPQLVRPSPQTAADFGRNRGETASETAASPGPLPEKYPSEELPSTPVATQRRATALSRVAALEENTGESSPQFAQDRGRYVA